MSEEELPCVIVCSSTEKLQPLDIIKLIFGEEKLPDSTVVVEDVSGYQWHIDTKYYVTDVKLCALEKKTIGNEAFAEDVQATIICFDSTKADSLDAVDSWMCFLKEFEAEVQILVCDQCTDTTAVSRLQAQEWCVAHGFELVEINPEPLSESESEECDFVETTGVKRIVQALHAHTWPNLQLKDEHQQYSRRVQTLLNGQSVVEESKEELTHPSEADGENFNDDGNSENGTGRNHIDIENGIEDLLRMNDEMEEDDADGSSFEGLFGRLNIMKQHIQDLPTEERKAYAEQVAIAFWRAMGGSEEEVAGLNEDST